MNRQTREPFRLADIAPLMLVLAATIIGVGLGKSYGNIWVKTIAAALMVAAMSVRYLYSRRLGLWLMVAVCAAYVIGGVALRWTSVANWVLFLAGTVAVDCLVGMIFSGYDALRCERDFQRRRNEREALVDEELQLRNLRSYQNDALIYLRIAKRHHLSLGLVLWKLDNAAELRAKLDERAYAKLMRRISRQMRSSLRFEDMIFLLDDAGESPTWGTLHIANCKEVCGIVERRLSGKLTRIEMPEGLSLKWVTRSCLADNEDSVSPMALLESVREKFKEEP